MNQHLSFRGLRRLGDQRPAHDSCFFNSLLAMSVVKCQAKRFSGRRIRGAGTRRPPVEEVRQWHANELICVYGGRTASLHTGLRRRLRPRVVSHELLPRARMGKFTEPIPMGHDIDEGMAASMAISRRKCDKVRVRVSTFKAVFMMLISCLLRQAAWLAHSRI